MLACVNGQILPIEEAHISIEDRGFQLGDGIYEVMMVYNGHIFMLEPHLKRLEESAKLIHLDTKYPKGMLGDYCYQLVHQSGMQNAQIYLQLTRGVYPRQHNIPVKIEPTLVITIRELPIIPKEVQVLTMEDIRWDLCQVKAIDLLPNVLAKRKASLANCHEAVFIREGQVMEGASNNIFMVKGDLVITPPLSRHILKGITRQVVLDICQKRRIPYTESSFTKEELLLAREVFLSGSHFEVRPVTAIDGQPIGDGKCGYVTEEILSCYRTLTRGGKGEDLFGE